MASKGHFVQAVDFPIWAVDFVGEKQLVVAGGGGAGRSGVKNSVVSKNRKEIRKGVVLC